MNNILYCDVSESNTLDLEMGFMSEAYLKRFPDMILQSNKKRPAETSSQSKAKVLKQDNDGEIDIPALADQKRVIFQLINVSIYSDFDFSQLLK